MTVPNEVQLLGLDGGNWIVQALQQTQDALQVQTVTFGALAAQPRNLGPQNTGLLFYVVEYGHLCYWTGTLWAPADEGPGHITPFLVAPAGPWWQKCDGRTVAYLTYGPALGTASIALPDLTGSVYVRGGTAPAGVTAATAPGASAAGLSLSGATASGFETTGVESATTFFNIGAGLVITVPATNHTHTGTGHTHGVGTLAVSGSVTVDATGQPKHADAVYYFRQ